MFGKHQEKPLWNKSVDVQAGQDQEGLPKDADHPHEMTGSTAVKCKPENKERIKKDLY